MNGISRFVASIAVLLMVAILALFAFIWIYLVHWVIIAVGLPIWLASTVVWIQVAAYTLVIGVKTAKVIDEID